jgi:hypothetical protein
VHPATLRGIEGGTKKPGRGLLRGLSEIYGVHPPVNNEPITADQAVIDAIDRQTAMLERVLAALTRAPTLETPERLREQQAAAAAAERLRERAPTPLAPDHVNATEEP